MKKYSLIYNSLIVAMVLVGSGCSKQDTSQSQAGTEEQTSVTAEINSQAKQDASTSAAIKAPESVEIPSANTSGAKLVRIATIEGVEKNAEFQRNLNIVKKQKQLIIAINRKLEQTKDNAEREKLKTALDQALAKLNENNQKMIETYGFTLARNYSMVIEKSQIFMSVTEEEAERFANK